MLTSQPALDEQLALQLPTLGLAARVGLGDGLGEGVANGVGEGAGVMLGVGEGLGDGDGLASTIGPVVVKFS